MEFIKKVFTIALTLVFIVFLIGVLFSPGIRENFVGLVGALFNEGLVGFVVSIFLLYLYYPVYKLFKNIFTTGSVREALSFSIVKSRIEAWIDKVFYLLLPIIILLFFFLDP